MQASLGERRSSTTTRARRRCRCRAPRRPKGSTGSDPFYLNFAVTLSAAATSEVTVQYRLLSGTAQAGG